MSWRHNGHIILWFRVWGLWSYPRRVCTRKADCGLAVNTVISHWRLTCQSRRIINSVKPNLWMFYFKTHDYRSVGLQTGYTQCQLVEITTRTLSTSSSSSTRGVQSRDYIDGLYNLWCRVSKNTQTDVTRDPVHSINNTDTSSPRAQCTVLPPTEFNGMLQQHTMSRKTYHGLHKLLFPINAYILAYFMIGFSMIALGRESQKFLSVPYWKACKRFTISSQ